MFNPPSLSEANAYHDARLTPDWTGTDQLKSAALVRALDYITSTFDLVADLAPDDARVRSAVIALAPFALAAPLTSETLTRDVVEETVSGDGVGSSTTKFGERNDADRFPFLRGILGSAIKAPASGLAILTVGKTVR